MVWQIPPRDGDLATGPPEKTGDTFQEASKGNKKVTRKAAGRRLLPCLPGCNEKGVNLVLAQVRVVVPDHQTPCAVSP